MIKIIFFSLILTLTSVHGKSLWTWECVEDTIDGPSCQRRLNLNEENQIFVENIPMEVCWLTCGKFGSLWPFPTGQTALSKKVVAINSNEIKLSKIQSPNQDIDQMIQKAFMSFNNSVHSLIESEFENPEIKKGLKIEVFVTSPLTSLNILDNIDESYTLTLLDNENEELTASIGAETFFGARHAFETLSQLIAYDNENSSLKIINGGSIVDKPKFSYRGVLIDTGRNYIPFKALRRMVDGLAANKLNVLHWHLTESNSFLFESKRVPQMSRFGSFDSKKIYKESEIKEFISYALQQGVKIIPELDAPSHAGNGWQWGKLNGLGDLAVCVEAQPYRDYCIQPPCGQLNPLNDNMYTILGDLYKDFLDTFDQDVFHMGGDEVSFKCWNSVEDITKWTNETGNSLMDLWGVFQERAFLKLKEANGNVKPIVWTSEMTNSARKFLNPSEYIIQVWSNSSDGVIKEILDEGYKVIFSNNDTMYLDHGFGPWRGTENKAKMIFWQTLYGHDILKNVENSIGKTKTEQLYNSGNILGGEATLWSEKGDEHNMDFKLWPRSSGLAERLWSNPEEPTRFAYPRLIQQRERMLKRGISSDTLLPEACRYIWGFCDDL